MGVWKVLYDWQTLITGGLAIVAALIGAIAAYLVGNIQVAAAKQKDRLQGRCIAAAISPELSELAVSLEAAQTKVDQLPTSNIAQHMRSAQIEIPYILSRNVHEFYILDVPTGPILLQLLSVIRRYHNLIETTEERDRFDPLELQRALAGHLTHMRKLISILTPLLLELSPLTPTSYKHGL